MERLFSQLYKTGKTDIGLATFPTPPLEKGLSHKGCALFPSVWKRCLWDPRKQPLLTLARSSLRESKMSPGCSQSPSIELCRSGSQKERESMLGYNFGSCVCKQSCLSYLSKQLHLADRSAGRSARSQPWLRGWSSLWGLSSQAALQRGCLKVSWE